LAGLFDAAFTVHAQPGPGFALRVADTSSRGNPPENAAIKGLAILGRPDPGAKFATRPRIAGTTRDAGQFGVRVDLQANFARYLAGEIPLRLQSSSNFTQWWFLASPPDWPSNRRTFLTLLKSLPSPRLIQAVKRNAFIPRRGARALPETGCACVARPREEFNQ
jgi:hypothetical protein